MQWNKWNKADRNYYYESIIISRNVNSVFLAPICRLLDVIISTLKFKLILDRSEHGGLNKKHYIYIKVLHI